MLIYSDYDIVFAEIPDEVTLAISLANCPNLCEGCHSPWLRTTAGSRLDTTAIDRLLERYGTSITCLCFMGGDATPHEVAALARYVRQELPTLKTGWYSGKNELPHPFDTLAFDYIKLGEYIAALGGLQSALTNQKLYRIDEQGDLIPVRLI